ncbi:hypothetical protein A9J31_06375 [Acinetobacter gandensis]|uniref:Uncharacterized protein n=1 Tax=Acinetobacter gandensis TaxID=1443941 RepID=A0A1A7R9N8_9GAMM|nr:hypothetical protein A9J31_06375 [Acinetobacter gandensis]
MSDLGGKKPTVIHETNAADRRSQPWQKLLKNLGEEILEYFAANMRIQLIFLMNDQLIGC